ncbi:MAG: hypothetical protein GX161_13435, partial [Firmicutes bacterium]|nr:hypothetical protein [Bacillota bacterium]
TLPDAVKLDTRDFDDGAYDLTVRLETVTGSWAERTGRVVLDNWDVIVDELQPPLQSGWFGSVPQRRTVIESDGWREVTGDGAGFFGDEHRLAKATDCAEHLIWEVERLARFELTLYARDAALDGYLDLAVSSDGETWRTVTYTAHETGEAASGWRQMVVQGRLDGGEDVRYFRLLLRGDAAGADRIQLGRVEFTITRAP